MASRRVAPHPAGDQEDPSASPGPGHYGPLQAPFLLPSLPPSHPPPTQAWPQPSPRPSPSILPPVTTHPGGDRDMHVNTVTGVDDNLYTALTLRAVNVLVPNTLYVQLNRRSLQQ